MRSSVFDELFGVSVLPIHCGIRVDSSAHLVEDQTDHKGCRVVDSGLCDIVSPRGTTENGLSRTAGGILPVPAKKIGQWTALRSLLLGNFFRAKNVIIGNRAPIQNICRTPEYILPMLYSLFGPIAPQKIELL